MRFCDLVRTDLDRKAIAVQFTKSPDVVVQARAYTLRLLLLGLIATTIDESSGRTDFSLVLMRAEGGALIEMQANIDFPLIDTPEMLLTSGATDSLRPCALVLARLGSGLAPTVERSNYGSPLRWPCAFTIRSDHAKLGAPAARPRAVKTAQAQAPISKSRDVNR